MRSFHSFGSLITLLVFSTCLDARVLDIFSLLLQPLRQLGMIGKRQQPGMIGKRQQPGVVATDVFLRRAFHSAVVVGNFLYIDGGQFSYQNNGGTVYQYSDATLSLDLSKDWINATAVLKPTTKPSDTPNLSNGALWYHQSEDVIYGQFEGIASDPDYDNNTRPPPLSLWLFKPDGSGSGQWSSTIDKGALSNIDRPGDALSASGSSSAWTLGGHDYDGNLLPGMIQFDMDDQAFSNISAKAVGGVRREGDLHYVPVFGPSGIYLALSGRDEGGYAIDFDIIPVFDPLTRSWYNQTTTGDRPAARVNACAAGIASTNTTYEIFIYNGNNGYLGTQAVPFDTINILTLPAFQWLSVPYNPQNPRHGHTCHAVGGGQILLVGGADSNGKTVVGDYNKVDLAAMATPDPNKQGLAVFNLTDLTWQDQYFASAPPYVQSAVVQDYYARNGQSYVSGLNSGVAKLLKTTNFPAAATSPKSNTTTTPTTTPTPTAAPLSGTNNTAAIAGGIVGGITGLAIVAGSVWLLLRRRKKAKNQKYNSSSAAGQEEHVPRPEGPIYMDGQWFPEMHGQSRRTAEMDERNRHSQFAELGEWNPHSQFAELGERNPHSQFAELDERSPQGRKDSHERTG